LTNPLDAGTGSPKPSDVCYERAGDHAGITTPQQKFTKQELWLIFFLTLPIKTFCGEMG